MKIIPRIHQERPRSLTQQRSRSFSGQSQSRFIIARGGEQTRLTDINCAESEKIDSGRRVIDSLIPRRCIMRRRDSCNVSLAANGRRGTRLAENVSVLEHFATFRSASAESFDSCSFAVSSARFSINAEEEKRL